MKHKYLGTTVLLASMWLAAPAAAQTSNTNQPTVLINCPPGRVCNVIISPRPQEGDLLIAINSDLVVSSPELISDESFLQLSSPTEFSFSVLNPPEVRTLSLVLPTGFDSNPLTVSTGQTALGEFAPGETIDFTTFADEGVPEFTITGITPSTPLSDSNTFTFSLQSRSVPEPSSDLAMLGISVLGAIWVLKRKQKSVRKDLID